ncbi:MAG TPA: polysaccharide deacetylase family protein [Ferruginibacter sp.]|nr:polysaccharide deacetylase family protein [Ferruginibacter sp.]HMP19771.1 polysaccharide deacetylase family protein [Ferruginibacter sp.]
MLLLYSPYHTARLQYTCSFILSELLGLVFRITTDIQEFQNYSGPKINYSNHSCDNGEMSIVPHGLLFENNIQPQQVTCFEYKQYPAFFKTRDTDWPFDIFSASFYLLSRYEEYLPHSKDAYGRYAHNNALAFKEGFLQLPLINCWANLFAGYVLERFPSLQIQTPAFRFVPTYDIDMAWCYKHKGWLRNIAGFIKSPSAERLHVLYGKKPDPFDSFEWLHALHHKYQLQPLYFFLLAQHHSRYDKNIAPQHPAMQQLVKAHAKRYTSGIHPSWQTGDAMHLLHREIAILQQLTAKSVTISRQHYIRFTLPEGYRRLIAAGITDDYSMGYGSINGFRASVASAFYWYDLEKNEQTALRVHPFCFMDANSYYEQHYSPAQAYDEMWQYYEKCKAVGGTLCTLWHNNFTGTGKQFEGWRQVYEQFINRVL